MNDEDARVIPVHPSVENVLDQNEDILLKMGD